MTRSLSTIDVAEAVKTSGDHPLVAHLLPYVVPSAPILRHERAVAITYHYWEAPDVVIVGPAAEAAELARRLPKNGDGELWVSLPVDAAELLPEGLIRDPHDWAFRWTDRKSTAPADAAAWLTPAEEDDVRALLGEAFPDASLQPGSPKVREWAGVRNGNGLLVACAADATSTGNVGFVASITTFPSERGRGLGRRITGWVVDRLIERYGRAALWMYAGNTAASAVYDRLGMERLALRGGVVGEARAEAV